MLSLQSVNVIDSEVILVGSEGQSEEKKAVTEDPSDLMSKDELLSLACDLIWGRLTQHVILAECECY